MSRRIFIDSSAIIEALKGNPRANELLNAVFLAVTKLNNCALLTLDKVLLNTARAEGVKALE